jgi:hypothetical protein
MKRVELALSHAHLPVPVFSSGDAVSCVQCFLFRILAGIQDTLIAIFVYSVPARDRGIAT